MTLTPKRIADAREKAQRAWNGKHFAFSHAEVAHYLGHATAAQCLELAKASEQARDRLVRFERAEAAWAPDHKTPNQTSLCASATCKRAAELLAAVVEIEEAT